MVDLFRKDYVPFQQDFTVDGLNWLDLPISNLVCRNVAEFAFKKANINEIVKCKLNCLSNVYANYMLSVEGTHGETVPILKCVRETFTTTPTLNINSFEEKNGQIVEKKIAQLEKNLFQPFYTLYEIRQIEEMDDDDNETERFELLQVTHERFLKSLGHPLNIEILLRGTNEIDSLSLNQTTVVSSIKDQKSDELSKIEPTIAESAASSLRKSYLNKAGNVNIFNTPFISLTTKPPVYDQVNNTYVLDMKGRAKVRSTVNFQIIQKSNPNYIVMQFGKLDGTTYSCDYSYPLNALQAFAIGLSCLNRHS